VHRELDLVTTPAGDPVAMVHCNNGASELNAWVGLFGEFARGLGVEVDPSTVFETLFAAALDGASDGGGMLAYNYLSGEPITGLEEGRPLFLRSPDSRLSLATFLRTQLFSSLATLRIGMDVLQKAEGVRLDRMFAHGGLFKTEGVAQRFLAAAIDTPVSVGDIAGEGGAWGIAVLAAFAAAGSDSTLADYLETTGQDTIGYTRRIDVVGRAYILQHYRWYGGPRPPAIRHDAIDDGRTGSASGVFYFDGKKWHALQGAD